MSVNRKHPGYEQHLATVGKVNDAFNGDVADRVPPLSGQTAREHRDYVERASYYNVVERAVLAIVGTLTRKSPVIEDLVGDEPHVDELSFDNFLATCYKHLLLEARIAITVDWDEQAGSSKLVVYPSTSIQNWFDGELYVLAEGYEERVPGDMFNRKTGVQLRVLHLNPEGFFQVDIHRNVGTSDKFELISQTVPTVRGAPLREIPLWLVTPYDVSSNLYKPPLTSLADTNINHFKQAVDYAHSLHFSALPQPWIAGGLAGPVGGGVVGEAPSRPQEISVGKPSFLMLREGSTVGVMETAGTGQTQMLANLNLLEERMASLSARLMSSKGGVESAEALAIRSGADTALLETLATSLEGALVEALRVYNMWFGSSVEPTIVLNREFTSRRMEPEQIKTLLSLWLDGALSLETLLTRLQEAELVDDSLEEIERLNKEDEEQAAKAVERAGQFGLPVPSNKDDKEEENGGPVVKE